MASYYLRCKHAGTWKTVVQPYAYGLGWEAGAAGLDSTTLLANGIIDNVEVSKEETARNHLGIHVFDASTTTYWKGLGTPAWLTFYLQPGHELRSVEPLYYAAYAPSNVHMEVWGADSQWHDIPGMQLAGAQKIRQPGVMRATTPVRATTSPVRIKFAVDSATTVDWAVQTLTMEVWPITQKRFWVPAKEVHIKNAGIWKRVWPGTAPVTGGTVTETPDGHFIATITSTQNLVLHEDVQADVLLVAGGGGGGHHKGGGGGGGGVIYQQNMTLAAGTYRVTIPAGGTQDRNGGDASIDTALVATGGGSGGLGGGYNRGKPGGSGGGGGGYWQTPSNAGGAGTAGQGNNGGSSYESRCTALTALCDGCTGGGGGGGAGAAGGSKGACVTAKAATRVTRMDSTGGTYPEWKYYYNTTGAAGGDGRTVDIDGTPKTYGGGGGGGTGGDDNLTSDRSYLYYFTGIAGAGGAGGGGNGGVYTSGPGAGHNGVAGTGGGGGGGSSKQGAGGQGGTGYMRIKIL